MKLSSAEESKKSEAVDLSEAFGFLHIAEVLAMIELSASLPDHAYALNLGAGTGTSLLALLEGNPTLHVITLDIVGGVKPTGGIGNAKYALNQRMPKEKNRCHWMIGDSLKILPEFFPPYPIHLAFVDGDHSYHSAKSDVAHCRRLLVPGGILTVHDYVDPENHRPDLVSVWGDVKKATDEETVGLEKIGHWDNLVAFRIPA